MKMNQDSKLVTKDIHITVISISSSEIVENTSIEQPHDQGISYVALLPVLYFDQITTSIQVL